MIAARDIESVVDQIVWEFHPARVILFGSYAYGIPTEDSDVDLMVMMKHRGPSFRASSRVGEVVRERFAMDMVVRSPAEIRRRLAMKDFFILDIIEKGITLHDSDDRRVGSQGRERLRRRLHVAPIAKALAV